MAGRAPDFTKSVLVRCEFAAKYTFVPYELRRQGKLGLQKWPREMQVMATAMPHEIRIRKLEAVEYANAVQESRTLAHCNWQTDRK
eukprot:3430538-Karenia_brevis.AAC.1